jgi:putative redox protein
MTMRLYADRKGIAADRFVVRLAHKRIHAEDCADCEQETGDIGEISKEVTIEGNISDEDRTRLFEIAAKCPVHKTLTHEIKIRSKLMG